MAVTTRQITSNILGLIGAAVGGVLGYYTFQWIFDHGFYGMMIPARLLVWAVVCWPSIHRKSEGRSAVWPLWAWVSSRNGASSHSEMTRAQPIF